MKLKDPCLRSEYSHPRLADLELDLDDFRDVKGSTITKEEFDEFVSKYAAILPETEKDIFVHWAYETFIDEDIVSSSFCTHEDHFDGADHRPFPCYKNVLKHLERDDELWTCYDKQIHAFAVKLSQFILDRDKVVAYATDVALHQISYNEEGTECQHAILYVLKVIVPYRDNSKWQNSVKRMEIWWQEAGII